mgnify:CR=1 FL=1
MKNIKHELKNGLIIFILIGAYFLLAEFFGFSDNSYLRSLNIIIVFFGVNLSIKQNIAIDKLNYFSNFFSGILTSFIGVILSIIGLSIYIEFYKGVEYIAMLSNPFIETAKIEHYFLALFLEGIASSVIVSFILMQYWKNFKHSKS